MIQPTTYRDLLEASERNGGAILVLVDPDKLPLDRLTGFVEAATSSGVDAFLVGGSLLHATEFEQYVVRMKAATDRPVIGFPGSLAQISGALDAVLYLSVVSSRNPEYLFGQHVHAAPLLHRLGLEPISTGYMLIESGTTTTAEYMTHSRPLPEHKPEIAAATALAAEMMGMRMLYADGGSGARHPVPLSIVEAICDVCTAPLVVGGGLRSAREIADRVAAGASFVVVGNSLEARPDRGYMAELAAAAHSSVPVALGPTG